MHVRQYYPGFFEGFELWEGDVETYQEFLGIPFIARLFQPAVVPDFSHLQAWAYTETDTCISGVLGDGKEFVTAFATGPDREEVLKSILMEEK